MLQIEMITRDNKPIQYDGFKHLGAAVVVRALKDFVNDIEIIEKYAGATVLSATAQKRFDYACADAKRIIGFVKHPAFGVYCTIRRSLVLDYLREKSKNCDLALTYFEEK